MIGAAVHGAQKALLLVILLAALISINVPIAVSICAVALLGIWVDKGVFGAPFYIVDGDHRFWGQDKLEDLDLHLSGKL